MVIFIKRELIHILYLNLMIDTYVSFKSRKSRFTYDIIVSKLHVYEFKPTVGYLFLLDVYFIYIVKIYYYNIQMLIFLPKNSYI